MNSLGKGCFLPVVEQRESPLANFIQLCATIIRYLDAKVAKHISGEVSF
jgi:hypothetical protein